MIKTKLIFICVLLINSVCGHSQGWTSAKAGTQQNDIAVDALGNTFSIGTNKYLEKRDPIGNLLWTKNLPTEHNVKTDVAGNVYVSGFFFGLSKDFGNGVTLSSIGFGVNAYIVKYTNSGTALWARTIYSSGLAPQSALGLPYIAVNDAGNCYVAGEFGYSVTLQNTTMYVPNSDAQAIYTAQYDPNGNLLWAKQAYFSIPQLTQNALTVGGIAVDNSGTCAVAGYFSGNSPFVLGAITLQNANQPDANTYVASYNSSGTLLWAKKSTASSNSLGLEHLPVTTDQAGNFYIAGAFSNMITFGNFTMSSESQNGLKRNLFVVKYNNQGLVQWAKKDGGEGDVYDNTSIAFNGNGGLFVALNALNAGDTIPTTLNGVQKIISYAVINYDIAGITQDVIVGYSNISASINGIASTRVSCDAGFFTIGEVKNSQKLYNHITDNNPAIILNQAMNTNGYIARLERINYPNVISGDANTYCSKAHATILTTGPNPGGNVMYTYQWQSRIGLNPWQNINGATSVNYSAPLITQTTSYRRSITSVCGVAFSNVITRTVLPSINNNLISGNNTFCSPTNPPVITGAMPSGGNNSFNYQWEASIDGLIYVSVGGTGTGISFDPPFIINQTIWYRRKVTSGSCTSYSIPVVIQIDQVIGNNTISGNGGNFCGPTDPQSISGSLPSGGSGTFSYTWQSSLDATVWSNAATTKDLDPPLLMTTTYFRRIVSSGVCNSSTSNSVAYIITPLPPNQNVESTGPTEICVNGGSTTLYVTSVPGVTYQWKKDGISIPGANSNSVIISGPLGTGFYRVDMTTCNTISSNDIQIKFFGSCEPDDVYYCESQSVSAASDWIDLVQLNDLTNITGNDGGYKFFDNVVQPQLRQTNSYSFGFSAGFISGPMHTEYWSVWIDFNMDNDFQDAGEQIISSTSSSASTNNATFIIPANATLGFTRMRVSMKHEAPVTGPCEIFNNGEVEDYIVNIVDPNGLEGSFKDGIETSARVKTNVVQAGNKNILSEELYSHVYPNPVKDVLHFYNLEGIVWINNSKGEEMYNGNVTEQVDVSAYTPGIYFMIVISPEGVRQVFKFMKK